jgi:hypothetical protein
LVVEEYTKESKKDPGEKSKVSANEKIAAKF